MSDPADKCAKCRFYVCAACRGKGAGGAAMRGNDGRVRAITCSACKGTGRGKCKDHR